MLDTSPLSPPIRSASNQTPSWGHLIGSSLALAVHSLACNEKQLTVVITPDTETARILESELAFFNGGRSQKIEILHLPDWETLPYDSFSPHQDIISERLRTLYRLSGTQQGILIIPISTLMHRLPPVEFLDANSLMVEVGQILDIDPFRKKLEKSGYLCVDTVYEHGEFAVRGSIVDIFPMGSKVPFRVDLFDDEIETLRSFDPETQLSVNKVDSIQMLPAKEFPLDEKGISLFRQQWHDRFDVDHRMCSIYQDIAAGISPSGIEYYLPLFFDHCSTLFDYLPNSALLLVHERTHEAAEHFSRDIRDRYESLRGDVQRPILPPGEIFLTVDEAFQQLKSGQQIQLGGETISDKAGAYNFATEALPDLAIASGQDRPFQRLEAFLAANDHRLLFCAESTGRKEALLEMLQQVKISPVETHWANFLSGQERFGITVAPIDRGVILPGEKLALITENQLIGERVQQRRRRDRQQESAELVVRSLTELKVGAPVVHMDHGVGRYLGLETITIDDQASEFLMLEYADKAKLYVPVDRLDAISRYSGAEDQQAPLHKLGSEQWQKARRKAAEQIRDTAAELLDIYSRRAARQGHAFEDPLEAYRKFSGSFPFEETADQQLAIESVYKDMLAPQPMDRLICGDVGFGKTEVAMRAAFIAAHSGRQVVVLVPTTLLAQQHYENFRDRFSEWPVNIEVISRFRSNKDIQIVQEKLAQGKVDIIIGTHKLLQSDMTFKDLGLLIIDEEHRFGVRQKEKLKALRAEVDILTLTATPIPRTLNMAMAGIRDLSIIATPPARRLSVKTFVYQNDPSIEKEAILREIMRGGQVYYLHNEVKTIERCARELSELVPEARVVIAHGQMRERQLEKVMADFYHKRFNVLVCTTIIETGIDVPNANTIIIDRADKFGLAQLHQLRGRVGRSHHQAYAYLLTPSPKSMTGDALKRLEAISQTTDLGAGFTLATHDLEIRGAGELLGEEQSGQMQLVGFNLYMEMLDAAVTAIREGRTPEPERALDSGIEINLRIPALIPEDYLPDVHSRLMMYKRIAGASNDDELRDLQVEMIDRFGLLPEACKTLFRVTALKLKAKLLGIKRIEASATSGKIEFDSQTSVNPLTIVKLVQKQPQHYKLEGASQLKFSLQESPADDVANHRLRQVDDLLKQLTAA